MAKQRVTRGQRSFGSGWGSADKKMRSDFLSLKTDGATVDVVFVGEPFTREEMNKSGVIQTRAYFPVLTSIGLQVWGVGKRVYNAVREIWGESENKIYRITRVGEKNNTDTHYEIDVCDEQTADWFDSDTFPTEKEIAAIEKRVLTSKANVEDSEDN